MLCLTETLLKTERKCEIFAGVLYANWFAVKFDHRHTLAELIISADVVAQSPIHLMVYLQNALQARVKKS